MNTTTRSQDSSISIPQFLRHRTVRAEYMSHQEFYPEFSGEWPSDNHRGHNPSIVNSVTNDEDDEDCYHRNSDIPGRSRGLPPRLSSTTQSGMKGPTNSHSMQRCSAPASNSIGAATSMDVVESYLVGYERMVKEQEREKLVTWSHLQPLLELLEGLTQEGQGNVRSRYAKELKNEHPPQHVENCSRQEHTGNPPLCVNSSRDLLKEYTFTNLQRALSIIDNDTTLSNYHLIKADEQFMMVLRLLCEAPLNPNHAQHNYIQKQHTHTKISWAEILQCYRHCIVGMQTLESLESSTLIRTRAKERTLRMLSMFRFVPGVSPKKKVLPEEKPNWQGEVTASWFFDDLSPTSAFANSRDVFKRKNRSMRQGWNVSVRPIASAVMLVCVIVLVIWHIADPVQTLGKSFGANPSSSTGQINTQSICRDVLFDMVEFPNLKRTIHIMEQPMSAQVEQVQSLPLVTGIRSVVKGTPVGRSIASAKLTPHMILPMHGDNSIHPILDSAPSFSTRMRRIEDIAMRSDDNINDDKKITSISSPELDTAAIVGGTATVLYFLLPIFSGGAATAVLSWIPTGLTVLLATMFGNDIRVWASRWRKVFVWRQGGGIPIRIKQSTPEPIG
jgi:hypothetical protein